MKDLNHDALRKERNKRKRAMRKKQLKTLTKKIIRVTAYPFAKTKRKIDDSVAYVFRIDFVLASILSFFIWTNLKNADKLEKQKEKFDSKTEELHRKFDSSNRELHQKVSDTKIELREIEARVQWRNAKLQALMNQSSVHTAGKWTAGIGLVGLAVKLVPLQTLLKAPVGLGTFLTQIVGRQQVITKAQDIDKQVEIQSNDQKAALQKNLEVHQHQKNTLQELQKKSEAQQKEIELLKNSLRQGRKDNKNMVEDVKRLLDTLENSYKDNSKLKQKQQELTQSNLEKKNAIQTNQNNLDRLESTRAHLQKQIEQFENENKKLQRKLSQSYQEQNLSKPNLMLQHSNKNEAKKNSSEFNLSWPRKKKKKSEAQTPTAFTGFDGQSTPTARISSKNTESKMLWEDSVTVKQEPGLLKRIVNKFVLD